MHADNVPQPEVRSSFRLSLAALILANLLPLGMVAADVWHVADVVFFYWSENLVVGFYNLLRIVTVPHVNIRGKLFLGLFFTAHYGGFCFIHMLFLAEVFGFPAAQSRLPIPGGGFSGISWPVLPLLVSHGYSFVAHYLLGGERMSVNEGALMFRPYGRIVVMHIWLGLGGYFLKNMNEPMAGLLVLVVLKTALDAGTHAYLHQSR